MTPAADIDVKYWHPTWREIADIVGKEAAIRLFSVMRGSSVNLPTKLINPEHYARSLENPTAEDLIQLGISRGHAYSIIKKVRKKR